MARPNRDQAKLLRIRAVVDKVVCCKNPWHDMAGDRICGEHDWLWPEDRAACNHVDDEWVDVLNILRSL